jgi:hypothetical protein
MIVQDHPIGRVSAEYAGFRALLVVTVRIEDSPGPRVTVNHEVIPGVTRVSISGGIWNRPRTDFTACGQIRGELDNLVSYAPGWNHGKVRALQDIWAAWHLNDMSAACAHQIAGEECPDGYKWGSAWLVREVPDDVIQALTSLFD